LSPRFIDAPRRRAPFRLTKLLRIFFFGAGLWAHSSNQPLYAATDSAGVAAEGTCRILAIRVQFPVEEPDELTTTGSGRFDLRPLSEALPDYSFPYDTPPHNRTYFEQHLQALATYYRDVSDGRLTIEYTVLPRDPDSAYELPLSGLTYGNGRSTEEVGENWLEFARHAVARADSDTTFTGNFSDFDSFLLFHPGQGQESGEINDIRSVFLSRQDLRTYEGDRPLTADSGQFELPHIWIVPETADQFGRAGLNGLLAKFFGFVLGLPSLSNGARGTAALGTWSLMDAGATGLGWVRSGEEWQATFGFLPPHPMAWSKARLGWIEPLTVRRDTTVKIAASDRMSSDVPKAVRVPISDHEYFLLENRQQRGHFGVPAGVDPPFAGFDDILWLAAEEIEFTDILTAEDVPEAPELAGLGAGVWTSAAGGGGYDAFIPGSGILIWHVDEAVIEAQFETGVNNDRSRPGIALEEADGFHHIGNLFFDQQDLAEGTPDDPFYAGSGPGGRSGVTTFGSATVPSSLSSAGIDTGIEIEVLSALGDTMEVAIRFAKGRSGWPQQARVSRRLQAADFGRTGVLKLIVEDETGLRVMSPEATLWTMPGAAFAAADEGGAGTDPGALFVVDGERLRAFDGSSITASSVGDPTWQVDVGAAPKTAAFAADLNLFPGTPVLAVGTDSQVLLFNAASGQQLMAVETIAGGLSVADANGDGGAELIISSADGSSGFILTTDGLAPAWAEQGRWSGPVSGDLDADGLADIVLISESGTVMATGIRGELFRSAVGGGPAHSAPTLGDVDGDGFLEIVVAASSGLNVVRANGLQQANFPTTRGGPLVHEPILADLDGDGFQEILVATLDGIMAFDDTALPLPGFPLLTESTPSWTPVVVNTDGDGALELAAIAGDEIYLWDLTTLSSRYSGSAVAWGQSGGRDAAGRFSHPPLSKVPGAGEGANLLPQQKVYCYPNPAGPDELTVHIRFFLSRAADLELEVFDALGERVERIRVGNGSMQVAAENEITFSAADLASGLYLCQLEATGLNGERASAVVKMAVSR